MVTNSILTVTTPAASQDLVTLSTIRSELPDSKSSDIGFLIRANRQASAAIASYCHRTFIRETVTETIRYSTDGTSLTVPDPLRLNRYPIASVASVTEDGVLLTADTDYEIDPDRGFLRRLLSDRPWRWYFQKLVVVYTGGYAPGSVPDDLQEAALRLITARFAARGRDPLLRQYAVPGVLEEQFWVGGTGDDGGLPPEVAGLADPYREVNL